MSDYKVERFGREKEPIIIIDDFYSKPDVLVELAAKQIYSQTRPFYPGVSAPADPSYLAEKMGLLQEAITNVFGFNAGMRLIECNYSYVTTPPDKLMPIQSLPHYDGVETGRLALLHYLCGPKKGGTAFFRHKATEFETITEERFETYKSVLTQEAETYGLPAKRYMTLSTDQFERIGYVEAKFNRCVLYRGILLHSGMIPKIHNFEVHPDRGRLTINTFLRAK